MQRDSTPVRYWWSSTLPSHGAAAWRPCGRAAAGKLSAVQLHYHTVLAPHCCCCCCTGNLSATWAEIDRLASILNHLENGNAAAAAVQPDELADPGGRYLSMLNEWRRQRIAAVHAEIRRLYREANLMKAGFERWMSDAVEDGMDAIAQVRRESAEQACTRVSGEGDSSSAAVETSAGMLQRVMEAVNPWYEEM